jgi:hypothetical protein
MRQALSQAPEYLLQEVRTRVGLGQALGLEPGEALAHLLDPSQSEERAAFLRDSGLHSEHSYLLLSVRVDAGLEFVASTSYTAFAQDMLRRSSSAERPFADDCGSRWTHSRLIGGVAHALVEFRVENNEQGLRLHTAFSTLFRGWRGTADLARDLARFRDLAPASARLFAIGNTSPLPAVSDLASLEAAAPALVDSLHGANEAYQSYTRSYDGVTPTPLKPRLGESSRHERAVALLYRERMRATDTLASIAHIEANLARYNYDPRVHTLQLWKDELTLFLAGNAAHARDCVTMDLDTRFASCREGDLAPKYALPRRRF